MTTYLVVIRETSPQPQTYSMFVSARSPKAARVAAEKDLAEWNEEGHVLHVRGLCGQDVDLIAKEDEALQRA